MQTNIASSRRFSPRLSASRWSVSERRPHCRRPTLIMGLVWLGARYRSTSCRICCVTVQRTYICIYVQSERALRIDSLVSHVLGLRTGRCVSCLFQFSTGSSRSWLIGWNSPMVVMSHRPVYGRRRVINRQLECTFVVVCRMMEAAVWHNLDEYRNKALSSINLKSTTCLSWAIHGPRQWDRLVNGNPATLMCLFVWISFQRKLSEISSDHALNSELSWWRADVRHGYFHYIAKVPNNTWV